jgi:hypothetical protein
MHPPARSRQAIELVGPGALVAAKAIHALAVAVNSTDEQGFALLVQARDPRAQAPSCTRELCGH